MTDADEFLVYDDVIGEDGLRWCDLHAWWMQRNEADASDAKRTLYNRLLDGIPQDSPPQLRLFRAYHKVFSQFIPRLPALLPEVWLHWDPKTVKERGPDALLRFRMDFLLLLPHRRRVVLEVDGITHYTSVDRKPDPYRYANNVASDRELKLAGYEVFRFGSVELKQSNALATVDRFFSKLYSTYGVLGSRSS